MNKKTCLILLLFLLFSLQGCYINPGANVGKLDSLYFFDTIQNPIDFIQYENPNCTYDEYDINYLSDESTPLNSPRPSIYYACVSIPMQEDIIIRFVILPGKNYHFESIQLGNQIITKEDVSITIVNRLLHVDYLLSKEMIQEGIYLLSNLKLSISNTEETVIRDGTTKPHSNITLKAIVFQYIPEDSNNEN
jgi:hypothetical protein